MAYSEDCRQLHKKLIVPNIILLIVSIVAALSLFLTTTLTIEVKIDGSTIGSAMGGTSAQSFVLDSATDETPSDGNQTTDTETPPTTGTDGETDTGNEGETDTGNDGEADTGNDGEADTNEDQTNTENSDTSSSDKDMMQFLLRDVNVTVSVKVDPRAVIKAALNSDTRAALKGLLTSMTEGNEETFEQVFAQIAAPTLAMYVIQESDKQDIVYDDLDTTQFQQSIDLLNAQKIDQAKASFLLTCMQFSSEQLQTPLTPDQLNSLSESFDQYVTMGTVDGTFSTANILSANGQENPLASLTAFDTLVDQMNDSTVSTARIAVLALAGLIGGVGILWAILALFALLHILLPNKKVAMWYVKLFGFLPCLLFFIAPLVMSSVAGSMLAEQVAILGSISFKSMTLISGICYLLMWILSIFVCHPIKKKIKMAKRAA